MSSVGSTEASSVVSTEASSVGSTEASSAGSTEASSAGSTEASSVFSTEASSADSIEAAIWRNYSKWILKNIKMRKCSYYIASTQSEGMCQCGYREEDHDNVAIDRPKQEQSQQDLNWNFERHSDIVPTNTFGEIEFVGYIKKNAKFVRVDSKTNIEMLLMLMRFEWTMQLPNIIISVIGGEENFNMTTHLRDMFQSSLMNLAQNRDVWIITGGTNIGVAKHVGDAVQYAQLSFQSNIVVIGIAPWGVIHNKQLLVDTQTLEPIQYKIEDKPIEHERFLNPNHSHYILVDNGTQYQFETETALRTELELKCNTKAKNGQGEDLDSMHVVLLVIDGGPHILKRVRNALSNSIPVVIVKGSGRVADLLAFAVTGAEVFESSDKDDNVKAIRKTTKRLTNSQRRYIYNKMRSNKLCETKDIHSNIKEIEACLDKFDLISIFELGSGDQDLNKTIVSAIIKAKKKDLVKQLRIALSWNLIDFARSVILTADKGCMAGRLDDIMVSAIQSDKVDFVELLLDKDFNIEMFLTTERLLKLYNGERKSKTPFSDLLLSLKNKKQKKIKYESTIEISMKEVGNLITDLIDDYYLQTYSPNPDGTDLPDDVPLKNPFLHLLIWAVLNNLRDMAKLFWRKGMDSIAAALLAHALFSEMASRFKNASPNLYEGIEANSREFMDLATGVLERCYKTHEDNTFVLLMQDLEQWEVQNCILIAIKTNNKKFITATACQEVFNAMWMGEMTQDNGYLKLLICTFIPPLILLCVQFKEKFNEPDPGDASHNKRVEFSSTIECVQQGDNEDSEVTNSDEKEQQIIEGASTQIRQEIDRQSIIEKEMSQCGPSPMDSKDEKPGAHEDSDVSNRDEREKQIIEAASTRIRQEIDRQSIIEKEMSQCGPSPKDSEDEKKGDHEDSDVSNRDEREQLITVEAPTQAEKATGVYRHNTLLQKRAPLFQITDHMNIDEMDGVETDGDDQTKYFKRAKKKILLFYRAPVVQFISHVISYMAFLCLYSYVLISRFDQNFSAEDVILIVCVFNIFIDEICQVIATRHTYTEIKLKAYLADFWNIADILMILLFVVGMILKHLSYQETLEAAQVVLGINLIICFLRLLQMFSLNKELGPKLVMIIRMVRNLTSFFLILLIFIVAYAIASHAILYPNTEITFNVLRIIFRRPYWNIYGDLMLDEIEGTNDCTNIVELYRNGTQPRCPTESGKYVVPVLMGMYMLICNILLLNLLISIFSNTYQEVQNNAEKHWRVERYRQMQDYLTRPMYIPFISFIRDIHQIVLFLIEHLRRRKPKKRTSGTNVFLEDVSDAKRNKVREWERGIAQDIINSKQADLKSIDNSVTKLSQRLDKIDRKIDALEEQQNAGTATIEDALLYLGQTEYPPKSESSTVDEPGSVSLNQRMDNIEKKLQWIVDTLKEHKPGAEEASPEKTDESVEG